MSSKNKQNIYQVKKEDTLSEIALKLFGDASLWQERLKKENGSIFTEEEAKNIKIGEKIYYEESNFNNKRDDNYRTNDKKAQKEKLNINHKELLTFSNAVNLEWQFVDLKPELEENEEENLIKVYDKLDDILSNPKSFVETDDEGNILAYQYGADDEGNFTNKEQGLAEMRREAGIAMEYLEKEAAGNFEAQFSKDWRE